MTLKHFISGQWNVGRTSTDQPVFRSALGRVNPHKVANLHEASAFAMHNTEQATPACL